MFENYLAAKDLIPSDPRFGCGPSLIPLEHLEKLAKTGAHLMGTSHRKSAVKNVVKSAQEGLKKYFQIPSDYLVVMGNGGATFLFDMIALGAVEKKVHHFTCGEFSEKWYKSSKLVPWIEAKQTSVPVGQGVMINNWGDADVVCGTLNETSTGVILPELPTVDDKTLLCIDATSGAGQIACDVSKTDIFFFSPQKVFASEGGLWIAIMSPKARARVLKIAENKSRYIPDIMSWVQAIENSEKNQTYNTPSISTLFLLDEQIKLMNQLGYHAVVEEAKRKGQLLYSWADKKPYLSAYIKEAKFQSYAVATIDVDEKLNVDGLLAKLEKDKIVYGIDAYRKLGRNQFRISLFHNIKYIDLEKLTKLLSAALES
jgi:phosphoserine aminotransferase